MTAGAANTSITPCAVSGMPLVSVIAPGTIRTYVRLVCDRHHSCVDFFQGRARSRHRYLLRVARRRIDTLLAERGLAGSRTSAAEAVRAGHVRLGRDGPLAVRPSQLIPEGAELQLVDAPRFVSRGGVKLANALDALDLDVAGLDCLDVGASTGGFTDCLLQRGAARVIALDVAHGQLDWSLREDGRVSVIERVNARAARALRASVPPRVRDRRRLVHLAREGAARRIAVRSPRAARSWRWSSRSSSWAADA